MDSLHRAGQDQDMEMPTWVQDLLKPEVDLVRTRAKVEVFLNRSQARSRPRIKEDLAKLSESTVRVELVPFKINLDLDKGLAGLSKINLRCCRTKTEVVGSWRVVGMELVSGRNLRQTKDWHKEETLAV